MAQTFIPSYSDLGNDLPFDRSCENCRFWFASYAHPVHARIAGERVRVGQCMAGEESESAPIADNVTGDAVIFTPAHSACECFEVAPEIVEETLTLTETHNSLDRELALAAWA
jgi:hypothetical protein